MSLPGLQISALNEPTATTTATVTTIVHDLDPNTEWRFEVNFGSSIEVKLLSGTAEIFGTELAQKQPYTFNGTNAAVFTWHGCRIEVNGSCAADYVAEETPMISYANTHFALEQIRQQCQNKGQHGPRVMIAGPENAGKTSLAKILTAYATRSGRQPIVVNLDTKEGMLSIPGSLSASAFSSIIDVEEGWGSSPTNGPSQVPVKLPLVYYYGHANPEENTKIYKSVVARLALSVMSRLEEDLEAREAGCIVDTPGSISQGKGGYSTLSHIMSEFSSKDLENIVAAVLDLIKSNIVNVLIVLGSERFGIDMNRRFNNAKTSLDDNITVLKLDKSGGCVDRDESYLKQSRKSQVRRYFFGDAKSTLSPHTQQLDFSQVTVYRAMDSSTLLTSLLPGGEQEDTPQEPPLFEKVEPSSLMQNCILAIMEADANDSQENIRDARVAGFVHVADVDDKKKKMRVLAPMSGRIPNRTMIWGTWPEGIEDLVA